METLWRDNFDLFIEKSKRFFYISRDIILKTYIISGNTSRDTLNSFFFFFFGLHFILYWLLKVTLHYKPFYLLLQGMIILNIIFIVIVKFFFFYIYIYIRVPYNYASFHRRWMLLKVTLHYKSLSVFFPDVIALLGETIWTRSFTLPTGWVGSISEN